MNVDSFSIMYVKLQIFFFYLAGIYLHNTVVWQEASTERQMFLFQFPEVLPLAKQSTASANAEENNVRRDTGNAGNRGNGNSLDAAAAVNENSGGKPADTGNKPRKGCTLKDLPSGFIGKLLIYKSGKVKMKIGDALFDVSGESKKFSFPRVISCLSI